MNSSLTCSCCWVVRSDTCCLSWVFCSTVSISSLQIRKNRNRHTMRSIKRPALKSSSGPTSRQPSQTLLWRALPQLGRQRVCVGPLCLQTGIQLLRNIGKVGRTQAERTHQPPAYPSRDPHCGRRGHPPWCGHAGRRHPAGSPAAAVLPGQPQTWSPPADGQRSPGDSGAAAGAAPTPVWEREGNI